MYETMNVFFASEEVAVTCIEQLRANIASWEHQSRKKRRFTVKGSPANLSGRVSDFEALAEKVRGWKRGYRSHSNTEVSPSDDRRMSVS